MRQKQSIYSLFLLSPSSRRAWIEIGRCTQWRHPAAVALLAEGVDRTRALLAKLIEQPCRSPHGGRG